MIRLCGRYTLAFPYTFSAYVDTDGHDVISQIYDIDKLDNIFCCSNVQHNTV